MAKGASIKFQSYEESIPRLLDLLKLQRELRKHEKIVLKSYLTNDSEKSVSKDFLEAVLKFCIDNKNPLTEVFIAEGADGSDTTELFDSLGYKKLAEKYSIGLIDLNEAETEEIENPNFTNFETIHYPQILKESFVISLSKLAEDEELSMLGSLSSMLGAFPAHHYKGFLSRGKNKIRKSPIKYSIHDIVHCKMPEFAVVDASEQGLILAGLPIEIDKQSAKILGKHWQNIPHIKLIDETASKLEEMQNKKQNALEVKTE
ncbi:DUF362 domain-containing protein [Candidatus Pacearchaeota archaeon]|nr:DUF362 domain-containing protein [Candidatus Pacearchaeota archaeon]